MSVWSWSAHYNPHHGVELLLPDFLSKPNSSTDPEKKYPSSNCDKGSRWRNAEMINRLDSAITAGCGSHFHAIADGFNPDPNPANTLV